MTADQPEIDPGLPWYDDNCAVLQAAVDGEQVLAARLFGKMVVKHGMRPLQEWVICWCDVLGDVLGIEKYGPGHRVAFRNVDTGETNPLAMPDEVMWAAALINSRFCDDQEGWQLLWGQLADTGTKWPGYLLAMLIDVGVTISGALSAPD
jgi:hypothetical protein